MIGTRAVCTVLVVAAALMAPVGPLASAATTEKITISGDGTHANGHSHAADLSENGLFVAFASDATNLDPLGRTGIFVRDIVAGANTWISNGGYPKLSGDGSVVAFTSDFRVFALERGTGAVEMIDVAVGGGHPGPYYSGPGVAVSGDGRYVAFGSGSPNLVPGDTNGSWDVFVRDRLEDTTERVSLSDSGAQLAQASGGAWDISPDGRFVTFATAGGDVVAGDDNGVFDVFVRDRVLDETEIVSVSGDEGAGNGDSNTPSMSADGRYVAFHSNANNLVPGAGTDHVYVRDREQGTTRRVSETSTGEVGDSSSRWPDISADGLSVAFVSGASNLVEGDTAGQNHVLVSKLSTGELERVTVGYDGTPANAGPADFPSISGDGRFVAWTSAASNLVADGAPRCVQFWGGPDPVREPVHCNDVWLRDRGEQSQAINTAEATLTAGGQISTNSVVSADDPVGTSVTTPVAGAVSIDEAATTTPDPGSYSLFGHQVNITAPAASVEQPLRLVFLLHPSVLPEGVDASTLQVFRNGSVVGDCTGSAGTASPNPCVESRETGSDGALTLTVLTSDASAWNFGRRDPYAFEGFFRPLVNAPEYNPVKAGARVSVGFSLGRDEGTRIFASGYPRSHAISCESPGIDLGDDQRTTGQLTYDPATQRYNYLWKSEKSSSRAPASCRQLVIRFLDGTERRLNFKLR